MSTTIQLPPVYRELVTCNGAASVEHAALDCRSVEVALAIALSEQGQVALVTQATEKVRWLLARWVGKTERETVGRANCFSTHTTSIWVVKDVEALADIPTVVDALVATHCHEYPTDPRTTLANRLVGRAVLFGEIAERGHWFYAECRSGGASTRLTLDAKTIVSAFSDQAASVLPLSHPDARRKMNLEDVDATVQSPFVFARSRLKVRTDKSPEYLSQKQSEEAASQFGVTWHKKKISPIVTLEYSPMQRRVAAIQRLSREKGFSKWVLVKYRRAGITVKEQAESYAIAVTKPRSYVASLADTMSRANRIFNMVRTFHEFDPFRQPLLRETGSELMFANNSLFFVGTAGGKAFARGDGLQRVHGFEVPYWCAGPRQMTEVEKLMAGISEAASNGEVMLEGTPNGREWMYHTYVDAKKGLNDYYPIFLRWFDDPKNFAQVGTFDAEEIRETLDADEKEMIGRFSLSIPQIAFRRAKKRALKRLFDQEYPEDDEACFLTSGICYFDVEWILNRLDVLLEPKRNHLAGGHEIIWEEPIAGEEYVAGCDTSEGLPNCDPNGVGILRRSNMRQVASIHGLFRPDVLADHAVRLCKKYNRAMLGIERQNHGHAVIQKVVELGYGAPHFQGGPLFYHQKAKDASRGSVQDKSSRAGWDTNAQTRDVMLNDLAEALTAGMDVNDRDLLSECLSFRLQPNGRFEADPGAHDDSVIKWAIAVQMAKRRRAAPSMSFLDGNL